jgi:hypothetical protein
MTELNKTTLEKYLDLCEEFGIIESVQERKELKGMLVTTLISKNEVECAQDLQKMIKALYD